MIELITQLVNLALLLGVVTKLALFYPSLSGKGLANHRNAVE